LLPPCCPGTNVPRHNEPETRAYVPGYWSPTDLRHDGVSRRARNYRLKNRSLSQLDELAAVDDQALAGDIGGFVRRQEQDAVGQFVRRAETAHWDLRRGMGGDVRIVAERAAHALGVDHTRDHDIDADVRGRGLKRSRLRHRDQRRLGGGIGAQPRHRAYSSDG